MNIILIVSAFLVLVALMVGFLLLGYRLGTQVNPEIYMSRPTKKGKVKRPGPPEPDIYQKERLDLNYE